MMNLPHLAHANFIKKDKGNIWVGVLIFLVVLSTIGLALISDAIVTLAQSRRQEQVQAAQAIADGGIEKAMWKLNQSAGSYTGETNTTMNGVGVLDITVNNVDSDDKNVIVTAYVPNKTNPKKVVRKVKSQMHISYSVVSFNYALQLGNQGLTMADWTVVNGSVYTSGNITNASQWWWLWWWLGDVSITGDAYTSGAGTSITNTAIGGNAHSHTLTGDHIGKDAYYKSISGTTVQGTKHANSSDPADVGLAVTDSDLNKWEQDVAADPTVATISGNYSVPSGQTVTIGTTIITGNLTINNATLILKGPVWVKGKITIQNHATLKLDTSYLMNSGMIISDGVITMDNSVYIQGNPNNSQSYIIIGTRASAPNPVIDIWWGADTDVAYVAPNGTVQIEAGVKLRAVSAQGLKMMYGVAIDYLQGMATLDIASGPGASWQIKSWQVCTNNLSCN